MVEPALALAVITAPRRLQSLAAAVQAVAAAVSSLRSTLRVSAARAISPGAFTSARPSTTATSVTFNHTRMLALRLPDGDCTGPLRCHQSAHGEVGRGYFEVVMRVGLTD